MHERKARDAPCERNVRPDVVVVGREGDKKFNALRMAAVTKLDDNEINDDCDDF